ncbi:putative G3BP-like protein isoform X1 [Senna tora]|uniref:Putative G3BP-like protein isoform X1 n=1 Tax=Senna tora TaxID=362788 RepID=A0A834W4E9_9FABA|nr:putative G3BP-like protein isoform X1 [Senna tora]
MHSGSSDFAVADISSAHDALILCYFYRFTDATTNDRTRYSSAQGGYRNDSGRGRGNYNGSQGYMRKDFEKRGEFSGRSRGNYANNAGALPRGYQNGGRVSQQAEKVQ